MDLYVSLGSNLGDREATIRHALSALSASIGTLTALSRLHETRPVGFTSENLFINAAARFDTTLPARRILEITKDVERQLGRTVKSHGGIYHDRTIDIDLLWLDGTQTEADDLTLPHPRMAGRRFVLEPLCEIAPALPVLADGTTAAECLRRLNRANVEEIVPTAKSIAEAADALNRLLPHLTAKAPHYCETDVEKLLAAPGTHLYAVRDEEGTIAATATLCICLMPTGRKAWIEDVVADPACRGRGYARALIRHLKNEARRLGAATLNLTSRPERAAANALYRSEGFSLRQTNVYRLADF